ncbi:MAG TPA: hypothetical protein VFX16_02340 [Pseudonocardiaceae bacterium]|nr:hypothetical protein [Pseudonocardiaceae bacterium]
MRRLLVGAFSVLILLGIVTPASAATGVITLTALSWSQPQVDATAGTATDTLTFTVADSNPGTTKPQGLVQIALRAATPSGFVQDQYGVDFGFPTPGTTIPLATLVSGDANLATFSYTFPVPRFAATATASWAVEGFQAQDLTNPELNLNATQLAASFQSGFTATAVPDISAPVAGAVTVDQPVLLHGTGSAPIVTYSVHVADAQSGAWLVSMVIAGPGGKTLHAGGGTALRSADSPGVNDGVLTARAQFTSVQDPAGTWTVEEIDVTDLDGNTSTVTGLSLAPIDFTDDSVVQASNFALTNNPVNDWTSDQTVDLTMSMTAPAPITSAVLDAGPGCVGGTPVDSGTGTVTVPITVAETTVACQLKGLTLTDSAGDSSVYGSDFRSVPQTVLPTITALTGPIPGTTNFTVTPPTIDWATGGIVTISLDVSSWGPGITKVVAKVRTPQGVFAQTGETDPARIESGRVSVPISIPAHDQLGKYQIFVTVTDAAGAVAQNFVADGTFTVAGSGGISGFVPVSPPVRVMDTRARTNGFGTLGPNDSLNIGLPELPANATAVVLNVTATDTTASSFLTVWPFNKPMPTVSNLNFTRGQTVANLVTVPVGADDIVSVFNHVGNADVVADLFGYYVPDNGSPYVPVTPSRVVDTRNGTGVAKGPVTAGNPVIASVHVPLTATSLVLNVTVTDATAASNVTVQAGTGTPTTSNLNFTAGQTVANLVVVQAPPLDTVADEAFHIFNHTGKADVIADLVGYYDSAPNANASMFVPATPVRVLDTRNTKALGVGGTVALPIGGTHGVPTNASAAVLNVTAVGGTASSFLTTWPDGQSRPGTSTLNFIKGQTVPNLAMTALGADGKVDIFNHVGSVNVIADLFGYFVPAN